MSRPMLHSLPIRVWHWINAAIVVFLLVTGFQFRLPGIAALSRNDLSSSLHRWVGVAMIASWLFWLCYGLATGHLRRHYAFRKPDAPRLMQQAHYYLVAMFRGHENPHRPTPEAKFNALQKVAYSSMMGLVSPLVLVTGLLFMNVRPLAIRGLLSWEAVKAIDALHVAGYYLFACFLVVHVYTATLGPSPLAHIKEMITGYEEPGDRVGENPEAADQRTQP